ncbi:MAG: hypothetical protein GY851_10290, partial [bacterium]|nr:hypothetical protein [bacterium]
MGRGLAGAVIAVIGAVYCAQGAVAAEGDTEFANTRHVYLRGESCELILHAGDADRVVFDASGWLDATCVVRDGVCRYTVDTSLLRSGDYTVRARLLRGDEAIGVARFPLTIAPAYDTERLPVWRWGGGSEPEWWMTHGFTGGFTGSVRDPYDPDSDRAASIAKSLDDAARVGFELGFYMRSISAAIIEEDEATRGLLPDGTRSKKICPLEPAVVDHAKRVTDSWLAAYGSHPGLRHVMLNSEVQPPFCVNDVAVRAAQEEIGLDARKFVNDKGWVVGQGSHAPKNGILEDANDRYRFLQWWWQRGHGTAPMQEAQNAIIKRHDPDLITWHEPYRLAPVRGSHKGLDLIATWTYGHPDIKRLCYTTYMQAAARPEGQLVQQDITLFVYGRFAIPLDESTADLSADFAGKDPYFTAGPDYAREAMWLVLSQRPDVLCFYSAGRLSPDRPGQDPYYASPATFEAIREMGDSLVKPYGPLIKACRRAEARVAVLMSAASTWFSSSARLAGYDNEQTLPFASLLMMNHVPFEVVLDDDIAEGALERYD